jgi:pimeloyl-ACP methyl ester carboxylesterase
VSSAYSDVHVTARDGLKLYARDYASNSPATPVLCLPGLTRNSRDFEPAVPQLSQGRRVIAMDFRGRGRSGYDQNPLNYRVDVETADAFAVLDQLNVSRIAVVGTSRGGLVGTLMANAQRARIAGLLLNDVGPKLEKKGLLRIRSYLGKSISFAGFQEAASALKAANPGFKGMSDAEWLAFARRLYRDDGGVPRLDYDSRLADAFPSRAQIVLGLPQGWPLFQALAGLPIALLRAENSDLLGKRTVATLRNLLPDLAVTQVANRGHAPFFDEPEASQAIAAWLQKVDAT